MAIVTVFYLCFIYYYKLKINCNFINSVLQVYMFVNIYAVISWPNFVFCFQKSYLQILINRAFNYITVFTVCKP